MSGYIKASQAAKELGITVTSLYKLSNHPDDLKKLEPINRSTYKGDGGFVYLQEDVQRIKVHYVREDLTPSECAKQIGRSTTYIHKLIKDGSLPSYEKEVRGKRTFLIKSCDLDQFTKSNPESGKYNIIYDKKTGTFLYQPFHKDGSIARVIRMKRVNRRKKEILLQVAPNEFISYEKAIEEGWLPSIILTTKKLITSHGYACFDFPIPSTLDSMIYSIIEELFIQVGAGNIRISTEKRILVEVKKSVLIDILPKTHPDMIDKMKLFIKSGEIIPTFNGTLIETGFSSITFYLPEMKKTELMRLAEEENMSLQEWIEYRLNSMI